MKTINNNNWNGFATATTTLILTALLAGCGGTRILKEPQPIEREYPLAVAADSSVEITLDWVTVRDGPGTWARNADWDEYLFRVANTGIDPVHIQNIVIYDALEVRMESNSSRKGLVKESRRVAGRYDDVGLEVKAGMGMGSLVAAGAVTGSVAVGTAYATLFTASAGTTALIGTGVLLTPVLITGGVMRGVNNGRVAKEIEHRYTELPVAIMPGAVQAITTFFPLTPSPVRIEVHYTEAGEEKMLVVDTAAALKGLHFEAGG